jgi:hypothetical protein
MAVQPQTTFVIIDNNFDVDVFNNLIIVVPVWISVNISLVKFHSVLAFVLSILLISSKFLIHS